MIFVNKMRDAGGTAISSALKRPLLSTSATLASLHARRHILLLPSKNARATPLDDRWREPSKCLATASRAPRHACADADKPRVGAGSGARHYPPQEPLLPQDASSLFSAAGAAIISGRFALPSAGRDTRRRDHHDRQRPARDSQTFRQQRRAAHALAKARRVSVNTGPVYGIR